MNYLLKIKEDYKITFLIIVLTAVLRIYFAEQNFGGFGVDPANFILSVQSYNIANDRPHLPGYYLHIQIIKLLQILAGNTQRAMITISIVYSAVAMGFFYLLLRRWFDIKISFLLTLLTLTNPMVWFYGCVTEIYPFDLFFSIALAWLGLSPTGIYLTPLFIGLLSGVRPSSGVLLAGLYFFLWYQHIRSGLFSIKKFFLYHLLGLAGFLVWFIPMINTAGGFTEYFSLYSTNSPLPKILILQNWYAFSSYFVFLLPAYVVTIIYFAASGFGKTKKGNAPNSKAEETASPKSFIYLMLSWCIPPMLFFFFYYYAKGYFLICAAPFLSLVVIFYNKKTAALQRALTFIIFLQTALFCFLPYSKPDVKSYFSPDIRQISIPQVWVERTNSVYQMSQSHIRAMEKDEIKIGNIINVLSDSTYKNYLILIDPTIPISVRALQTKYPKKNFCSLLLHENDQYAFYSGLNITAKRGLNQMFERAFIISRTDFVNNYLKNIEIDVNHFGTYSIYKAQAGESKKLVKIYFSLFSRLR